MPRTVQLSEEAYAALAAVKQKGDSFSDVVNRLVVTRKDVTGLRKLAGGWEARSFEEAREGIRQSDLRKLRDYARGRPG